MCMCIITCAEPYPFGGVLGLAFNFALKYVPCVVEPLVDFAESLLNEVIPEIEQFEEEKPEDVIE